MKIRAELEWEHKEHLKLSDYITNRQNREAKLQKLEVISINQ